MITLFSRTYRLYQTYIEYTPFFYQMNQLLIIFENDLALSPASAKLFWTNNSFRNIFQHVLNPNETMFLPVEVSFKIKQ